MPSQVPSVLTKEADHQCLTGKLIVCIVAPEHVLSQNLQKRKIYLSLFNKHVPGPFLHRFFPCVTFNYILFHTYIHMVRGSQLDYVHWQNTYT